GDLTPNINVATKFFTQLSNSKVYKKIFYVPGNHEFYTKFYPYKEILKRLKAIPSVSVLHNEIIEEEEAFFLGGTMWTNVSSVHFQQMNDSKNILSAFRKPITAMMVREWHKETLE